VGYNFAEAWLVAAWMDASLDDGHTAAAAGRAEVRKINWSSVGVGISGKQLLTRTDGRWSANR